MSNYWAYKFECEASIEEMLRVFNELGPWTWQVRDSSWYGDYVNSRPTDDLRVRIHRPPDEETHSGLLELETDDPNEKQVIDDIFRGLLAQIGARDITEIEPYD
jgi:hypothetical protein